MLNIMDCQKTNLCKLLLLSFLSLIFMVQAKAIAFEKKPKEPIIHVTVDPRIEFFSIIFYLAGNPEYTQGCIPSYRRDVQKHFGKHRNHPVIRLARTLRKTRGLSYDAPMSMAVHVTDAYSLDEKMVFDPHPERLDKRWTTKEAREFLVKLRNFVKETDFEGFIREHQKLYEFAILEMKQVLQVHGSGAWFNAFFGDRPGTNFTIALALLNGALCYGAQLRMPDGYEELYCVLGVWMTDERGLPELNKSVLPSVVHEFCHSYINPLVDKHQKELRKAGTKIYPLVADSMKRQAYSNWKIMMYESIVRACVVRYILENDGEGAARRQILVDLTNNFLWIEELSNLLRDYETQREKYPTLDAFFPQISAFFNENSENIAKIVAKTPKIVSIVPPNNSKIVNPDLKFITITFDRPMMEQSWSIVGEGPNYPRIIGKPKYDLARKILYIQVELKPDWHYEFSLNSEKHKGFRSEEGVPLIPVLIRFKTRKR